MGLFGLGNFGTGFVEGFATSANEALKADLKKVDLRVEKVADAKMKRALKQQEERAEELEEIEDALEKGRSLFGTDDPRSAQYAASLLKQEGNLASYKSLISRLQEQTKNSSVNLTDYIQRAEIDSPTGTISDYAKSFQGAAKTLPSYKLPDDIESYGAGSLLSAIGLDQNVSGQIQRNVSEQLAAEGITAEELPNIDVPTLAFDMEGVRMFNMTPSERVTFLKQELARPGNTEERKQELQGDLQAGLLAAKETGDDATQLDSLDMQLGFEQDPKKVAELQAQRKVIDRRIKIKSATNEKDRLLLESGNAASDGDAAKAVELARKAEDFGTFGPLLPESLERMQEDNMRNISNHTNTGGQSGYAADSEEAKAAQVQINALKQTIEGTEGAKELDMTTYQKASNGVYADIKDVISNSPELLKYWDVRPGDIMPTYKAGMTEENKTKATAELRKIRKTIVNNLIETYPEGSPSRIAHEAVKNNMIRAGLIEGSVAALPAETKIETSRTLVKPVTPSDDAVEEVVYEDGSVVTVVAGTNTPVKPVKRDPIEDSAEGARDAIAAQKKGLDGYTIKEIKADIAEAKTQFSPAFVKVLEDELKVMQVFKKSNTLIGTDETMVRTAMESGIDYAEDGVDAAAKIVERVKGFASKEIRAIEKELGISKAAAKTLYDKVIVINEKREVDEIAKTAKGVVGYGKVLRKTKNLEQWEVTVAKYMEITGRSREETIKSFPPPKDNKNLGGLMSRN